MTFQDFEASLASPTPPPGLPTPLVALWHDGRGDWDAAHHVAQDIASPDGSWIHAYLHRKEGDADNAAYWYGRARKPVATASLEAEWRDIVIALLARTE